jgi:hypothetical protein
MLGIGETSLSLAFAPRVDSRSSLALTPAIHFLNRNMLAGTLALLRRHIRAPGAGLEGLQVKHGPLLQFAWTSHLLPAFARLCCTVSTVCECAASAHDGTLMYALRSASGQSPMWPKHGPLPQRPLRS